MGPETWAAEPAAAETEAEAFAALSAECLEAHVVEDTATRWAHCAVQHPTFGTLTTRGPTGAEAIQRMRALIAAHRAERAAAAPGADATAYDEGET